MNQLINENVFTWLLFFRIMALFVTEMYVYYIIVIIIIIILVIISFI